MKNPLLEVWNTPFSTPPFTLFEPAHYGPAIKKAIEDALTETESIANDTEEAGFENTIAALDNAGEQLGLIASVLFNLNSAETSPELQAAAREVSPLLARFSNDITMNEKLFARVKTVYDKRLAAGLSSDQLILTEKKYRNFIHGGASLDDEGKKRFREISEELSTLSLRFEENVLEETNAFILHLTQSSDLEGLPPHVAEAAKEEAATRGKEGWVFTLHFPSYVPFMQYSERRELREKMFRAYTSRCFRENESDNRDIVVKITNLRLEMAIMLGYSSCAEMILGDRMADTPEKVNDFLDRLFMASRPAALRDYNTLCAFAAASGHSGPLMRWDWAFWSEKLKKKLYDIDDEVLRPYLSLEKAEKAVFGLATALYGLSFMESRDIELYHIEVRTFEVYDYDGSFLALLYTDYHPRQGKSGGAWMTSYREQHFKNGTDIRPLVSIVCNFTRPSENLPSLLSFNELTTFLHEFGHALHGMLSKCRYESLSGTNVARDFVELPSQFMENYAYEKEWLDTWAFHYQTGEKIPEYYIKRIREAMTFNEGYACNRQLGFAYLDMGWNNIKTAAVTDITSFEQAVMEKTELFEPVENTSASTSFTHIFSGGYAAGYYGYKWAEVLDADAFSCFSETGVFNKETASRFRKCILERGASERPATLYYNFRGREPELKPFLERSGLAPASPAEDAGRNENLN